ncbi:MAG: hypothetical protein ACM3PT_10255 [Deltaproteobacteria bacterium]
MKTHESFKELIEKSALPLIKSHPDWIRLDGQTSGGNRKHFAWFRYNGNTWKVHSDTHIAELMKAYKEIIAGREPFIISKTNKNGNICLELIPELAGKPKHIYIYMMK